MILLLTLGSTLHLCILQFRCIRVNIYFIYGLVAARLLPRLFGLTVLCRHSKSTTPDARQFCDYFVF